MDIPKLKYYCNIVIPQIYSNALSYYEQICAIAKTVNDIIEELEKEKDDYKQYTDEQIAILKQNLETQINNLRSWTENEFNSTNSKIDTEILKVNNEITKLTTEVTGMMTSISTINQSLATIQETLSTINNTISSLIDKVTENRSNISALQTDVGDLKTDVSSINEEISTIQTNLSTAQTDITTLQSEVASLKENQSQMLTNISTLTTELNAEKDIVDALTDDVAKNTQDIADIIAGGSSGGSDISLDLWNDYSTTFTPLNSGYTVQPQAVDGGRVLLGSHKLANGELFVYSYFLNFFINLSIQVSKLFLSEFGIVITDKENFFPTREQNGFFPTMHNVGTMLAQYIGRDVTNTQYVSIPLLITRNTDGKLWVKPVMDNIVSSWETANNVQFTFNTSFMMNSNVKL